METSKMMILSIPIACLFLVAVGIHGRNIPSAEGSPARVIVLRRMAKGNPKCTAARVTLETIKEGYDAYMDETKNLEDDQLEDFDTWECLHHVTEMVMDTENPDNVAIFAALHEYLLTLKVIRMDHDGVHLNEPENLNYLENIINDLNVAVCEMKLSLEDTEGIYIKGEECSLSEQMEKCRYDEHRCDQKCRNGIFLCNLKNLMEISLAKVCAS
ncbi:unnamed protein product [Darwinula stevensoni]|uniref:Uncharacterized protein n=1 Tax=Darwinula stevensoni TaxID=69355 RepID=A0A7R8XES5_9CRUS|nr:unnamed protein product [Darwinula stevensoni]CAG0894290.1 unnamed protein product [Darwinula stevensoni]